MANSESITLGPWLWTPGSPFSRHPGMTPLMTRICGSTFPSSPDSRVSRPRRRRRAICGKRVAAGNDIPPANQKKQPTYKEH